MKIVSLFSGCGGLDLGFKSAGFEIVWANDVFEDAARTYRRNIGGHISAGDISKVDLKDIPVCDGIIGGFPCQGFSVANTGRTVNDERNKLYLEFVRVVNGKTPKFFVAENVKGILTLGKGAVFEKIKRDFENCGYEVLHKLLNAADYGVPQKRERVILFGVRRDLLKNLQVKFPPDPTHACDVGMFPELKPWVSSGEALRDIPEPGETSDIPNHTGSRYKLRFNGYLGHRMIDPNQPAPTVTARGDERGGVVIIHHPGNHRRMTVREVALIQSFPLDFIFEGTNTSAYRQIGNAVPPKFAECVARSVAETFAQK
ncbi:MAG: DNA cytosine methyltransferase [Alphaproteobacteria bacterium]|nr:DNA cytosine methyltransferase [Alphaproteobacteria bacterium]MDA8004195.1 DNA cytosine methyltransferase [Alphaproteobacteria bacterium]MDA8006078.1 DNA cytosine methyltransferase [Alphaproteobacteria bacterium]MDA8013463.1 DNA cytosine methyltransferase [Alphaproteobacteria bacterium]